jgi:hypothetical protein
MSPKVELFTALACQMSDEEVRVLVSRLPPSILYLLQQGPIPGEKSPCWICEVMGDLPGSGFTGKLFAWHLGVDIHGIDGPVGTGDECYRRCLVIYRAAGWEDV